MLPPNQHFLLSAVMNGTQRRTHEEYVIHTVVRQKAPLGPKLCQTVKKIRPIALAINELCLSEGISQSVTQSVSQSVTQSVEILLNNFFLFFKFHHNFLKVFQLNLKASLGLVRSNQ